MTADRYGEPIVVPTAYGLSALLYKRRPPAPPPAPAELAERLLDPPPWEQYPFDDAADLTPEVREALGLSSPPPGSGAP